jgi:hypothetical protein
MGSLSEYLSILYVKFTLVTEYHKNKKNYKVPVLN